MSSGGADIFPFYVLSGVVYAGLLWFVVDVVLWRSAKYECVYLHAFFETGSEARAGIGNWVDHYNIRRPHSSLRGRTPAEVREAVRRLKVAA